MSMEGQVIGLGAHALCLSEGVGAVTGHARLVHPHLQVA